MLDVATYEEVEADESATGQAAVVVALAAVASAIGAIGRGGLTGMIMGLVMAIVGWLAWAGITYFVGTRLFKGTATWGELLRTIGFAQAPGILLVLAIIPVLGMLVRIAVTIWVLVAGIVAIRQALDFDTGKAVMTALVGWLVMVVLTAIVGGSVFRGMM
jgi:hypothetical protein